MHKWKKWEAAFKVHLKSLHLNSLFSYSPYFIWFCTPWIINCTVNMSICYFSVPFLSIILAVILIAISSIDKANAFTLISLNGLFMNRARPMSFFSNQQLQLPKRVTSVEISAKKKDIFSGNLQSSYPSRSSFSCAVIN